MLLPRYRDNDLEPEPRRRLDEKLLQIENRQTTTIAELATPIAPLDTIDKHRRGIPLIARGIAGTSPGTNPLAEVLKSDRQPRYTRRNR